MDERATRHPDVRIDVLGPPGPPRCAEAAGRNAGPADAFINVPIHDLPGEYLVVRPSAVQGIRVEPVYGATAAEEF
ncbi:MAG: hypothetical protein EBQ99_11185 [Planctomycetes bacterium]|nr:hypothetical protein [Planctomycetota bacterium]